MNKYELALVLSTKIEDEDRTAALEKIQGFVTRFGGTVKDVEDGGRRKLAYEIQNEKEGYYYFVHFEAPATCPAEIESRVRIMEPVLRYLCVRQDA